MSTSIRNTVRSSSPAVVSDSTHEGVRSIGNLLAAPLLIVAVNVTMLGLVEEVEGANFTVNVQLLVRMAACALLGAYGLLYLPKTQLQFFRFPAAWATLFGLWAAVTVPFSIAPMYSATAVFTLACVSLFVPAVMLQLGGWKTIQAIVTGLLLFVALNWVLYFVAPGLVVISSKTSIGTVVTRFGNDPQQLGFQIVWAIGLLLVLAFNKLRTWRSTFFWLAVLSVTLLLTQSRTAGLAAIAAIGVAVWTQLGARSRLASLAAGTFAIAGAAIILVGGLNSTESDALTSIASRSGDVSELSTLTGRVDVWEFAWNKFVASPIVGCGYGAARFALQEDPNYPLQFQANHAHNLLLNVALTSGIPGALLLVLMVGHLLLMNIRSPSPFPSIALALIIVSSVTEPVLYFPMPHSHMFLWLIAVFWQQMGMDSAPLPVNANQELAQSDIGESTLDATNDRLNSRHGRARIPRRREFRSTRPNLGGTH